MSDARAMNRLLDRPIADDDLRRQTEGTARPVELAGGERESLLIVRLGGERLALAARDVVRVRNEGAVHRIPHRTGPVLRGLCNIDGELVLTVALERLLGLGDTDDRAAGGAGADARRMVVVASEHGRWAFAVDAVEDVRLVDVAARRALPDTVEQALVHHADAIIDLDDGIVTRLDTTRVVTGLEAVLA